MLIFLKSGVYASRGSRVSPGTVNKDLRYVRQALRKAKSWKMIPEVPEITF